MPRSQVQKRSVVKIQTSISFRHWVNTNKYLISFIVLLSIALVVIGSWKLSPFFILNFLPGSILTVGIVWSLYTKKKGAALLVGGTYLAWIALISWLSVISHKEFEPSFFTIAVISTLLSVFFIFFGIMRIKQKPK